MLCQIWLGRQFSCQGKYNFHFNLHFLDIFFQYYIHSYSDVAHITSRHDHKVGQSQEMEINYKMIETSASPNIKYLSPTQRRCRFEDESLNKDSPIYSTSMCYMLCRYKLALKLCGCKPHFYQFLGLNHKFFKIK